MFTSNTLLTYVSLPVEQRLGKDKTILFIDTVHVVSCVAVKNVLINAQKTRDPTTYTLLQSITLPVFESAKGKRSNSSIIIKVS